MESSFKPTYAKLHSLPWNSCSWSKLLFHLVLFYASFLFIANYGNTSMSQNTVFKGAKTTQHLIQTKHCFKSILGINQCKGPQRKSFHGKWMNYSRTYTNLAAMSKTDLCRTKMQTQGSHSLNYWSSLAEIMMVQLWWWERRWTPEIFGEQIHRTWWGR